MAETFRAHEWCTLRPMPPSVISNSASTDGERLEADTRLIIAPGGGVFVPALEIEAGRRIAAGEIVGHVISGSQTTPVVSPFTGHTGAALAWRGERLNAHQPVMWLSVNDGAA